MKWLVCKAEYEFNEEQDCSMHRAVECVQVFNSENEALETKELFDSVDYSNNEHSFTYIVISQNQIGELVR